MSTQETARSFQAGLWGLIAFDQGELRGNDILCKTPRMIEGEEFFHDLCEKFNATLDADQQSAFYGLMEIVESIKTDNYETGIAFGLRIATELRAFLDHPEDALRQASASCTPFFQANKGYIQRLEGYFHIREGTKEQTA